MLFVLGLMGLTAVGATMMMGGDEEDMMTRPEDQPEEADISDEQITDIGSMIPEDNAQVEDASDPMSEDTTPPVDPSPVIDGETAQAVQIDGETAQAVQIDGETVQAVQTDPAAEGWTIQTGDDTSDVIDGGAGNEFLLGYGGDDLITGNSGMDQIEGGDGDDTLSGGADNDELHGDDGDDHLMGDAGDDTLSGHFGDDLLEGGEGDDSLIGGQGDDVLDGGAGDDALHGYHGDDALRGGEGQDTLFGSLGDDILHGLSATGEDDGAVDYLNGGEGDDLITAGAGDIVTAGEGADQIQFGAWDTESGPTEVLDYEAQEDSLVVLYDDATQEPEINVEQDENDEELYRVMADGELIAQIYSATPVTAQSISLVAQSAA